MSHVLRGPQSRVPKHQPPNSATQDLIPNTEQQSYFNSWCLWTVCDMTGSVLLMSHSFFHLILTSQSCEPSIIAGF
jgi:hypothetical protein